MCSSHQPEWGADSTLLEPGPETRKPYVVDLRGRFDDHERFSIRINAWGRNDAKGLAEDIHPGFVAVDVREAS